MNTRDASKYLRDVYQVDVSSQTIARWLNKRYIEGCLEGGRWELTEDCLDSAIEMHNIPRKVGRKAILTKNQREQIREMYDHKKWSQKKIANHFGISSSYVSLIVRGLR